MRVRSNFSFIDYIMKYPYNIILKIYSIETLFNLSIINFTYWLTITFRENKKRKKLKLYLLFKNSLYNVLTISVLVIIPLNKPLLFTTGKPLILFLIIILAASAKSV